jgi:protoheme IX farnesyltransferase
MLFLAGWLRMKDLLKLIRPWIAVMVLFAMASAAWAVDDGSMPLQTLIHGLVGTALLVSGSGAFNQRYEIRGDGLMARTADRPLPAGRMTRRTANVYATLLTLAGLTYLAVFTNWATFLLGGLSWLLYVGVYTPLKSITPWQTPIGALAGAMPMLMGAAVAGKPMDPPALTLFGIIFFWQMPHSMAIAWRYRQEFASAGIKLATVVEPSGRAAGWIAVFGALMSLLVSLVPFLDGQVDASYAIAACVLGWIYLVSSYYFLRDRNGTTSRWLQCVSMLYLPAILIAFLASKTS